LREGFMTAVVALAAWDVMKDDDAIAGLENVYASADGGDYSGSFVAEDAGRGVRSGGNFLEVGAADSAGVNFEQKLARADGGNGNGFETNVIHAAVDGG
jgi:hypothetical protein